MIDIVAPHLPAITPPGGLIYAPDGITVNVGGHAANTSIDLAQLGQKGVSAAGCIGEDMLGIYIEDQLKSAGVDPKPQRLHDVSTAKNISLIVEGEDRRFIAELAANTLLSPDHIIKLLEFHPRIIYIGTIGGLRYVDGELSRILKMAHEANATTIVDVIPPTEPDWKHLTSALGSIDILHLNEEEARLVTGVESPKEAAEKLREKGAHTVIVTKGRDGLVSLRNKTTITMPGFRVEEIDPTGAGDALCAGIIHSLLHQPNSVEVSTEVFVEALLEGQAAGASCVTSPGATSAVTAKNVLRLLKEQSSTVLGSTTLSL